MRYNKKTLTQDAQKVQTSHPPNPGAPRRTLSQTRLQRATKGGSSKLARLRCPMMSLPLRALSMTLQFSLPLPRGVAEVALYCAHRTSTVSAPFLAGGLFQRPAR
jgi:hypothetical protein